MDKLKIYACSGLDDEKSSQSRYAWWSDDTNTITNTQAVNALLVKINLLRAQILHLQQSHDERTEALNALMLYAVALYFVRLYDGNYKSLENAGKAIGTVYEDGAFANASLNLDNADTIYNQIIARVNEILEVGAAATTPSEAFTQWWQKHIVSQNKYGLNKAQRERMQKAVKGIGKADDSWKEDTDISEYLTNASEYFLYLYFTDKQLRKLPAAFRDKAEQQAITYDYCKDVFVGLYGTEEDMQDVIRAGIIGYFNHTPEEVCDKIASGEKVEAVNGGPEPLSWTIEAIIAVITLVLNFIAAVVAAICQYAAREKEAQYAAIDQAAIEASCPAPEDYEGLSLDGLKSSSSWIPLAAIGLGALILLKN